MRIYIQKSKIMPNYIKLNNIGITLFDNLSCHTGWTHTNLFITRHTTIPLKIVILRESQPKLASDAEYNFNLLEGIW